LNLKLSTDIGMSPGPISYTSSVITDLTDRTEYEVWLLEAIYDIAEHPVAASLGDGLIYPPDGSEPKVHSYATANMIIGDWRPKFREVGAPLVLVTSFKLLDMLIEWVLTQNRVLANHKSSSFYWKIEALKGTVIFPPLIESRPWLRERLVALYKELDPLRGTIIHERHFQSSGGTLQVASSRHGTIGPTVTFSAQDLRSLSVLLVSLIRYLEGLWTMDIFQEKRIRRTLDELAHLHRSSSLGQLPPYFLTVRIYRADEDLIEIDLDEIRDDIASKYAQQDTLFEIRLIVISKDGQNAFAYRIPWEQIQNVGAILQKRKADLVSLGTSVPDGIDPIVIARDLGLGM
jgi:hypothetical protein